MFTIDYHNYICQQSKLSKYRPKIFDDSFNYGTIYKAYLGQTQMQTNDRITPNDLIEVLQDLITKIKEGAIDTVDLQDIYDSVYDVMNSDGSFGGLNEANENVMDYTFRGWWLTTFFKTMGMSDDDYKGMFNVCPNCKGK